jgi:signal transduction histidine kinase
MSSTVVLYGLDSDKDPERDFSSAKWSLWPAIRNPLIVLTIVFLAALAGILLQPHGLLSSFWPANAILLGLMLRIPAMATVACWLASTAGFILADLVMGSGFVRAALLTAGNLAGIGVCFLMFRRLSPGKLALRCASSPLFLMGITLAGSLASGLVGMVVNPILFNRGLEEGFTFWAVSEFTNYLAVLPLVLTVPFSVKQLRALLGTQIEVMKVLPALTCVAGALLAPLASGPSSLLLPVPGLIWCALVYDVAVVAALTGLVGGWMMTAPAMHWVSLGFPVETFTELLSLRLGIALILLGPISIACVMASREKSVREAAAAREAAEGAMASRALMLATMTHELRSPLNIIAGYAQLIEHPLRNATPKDYSEYGEIIHEAAAHMNVLVTDLLDTARVEAGQARFTPRPTDSRVMIDQSTRLVAGMAMERRITIRVQAGYWPTVEVDARMIKQVMINLLSNAIRHSRDSSTIVVTSQLQGGRLAISVTDKGAGISAADLERLGRAYQQAGDGEQRQGTGLGLALSMDLIARHGGKLTLSSELGKGTTATFDMPLSEDVAANDD